MTAITLYGSDKLVSYDTIVKWSLLLVIGLVDWAWMTAIELHVAPGFFYALISVVVLIGISLIYTYNGREQRIVEFAHFTAQLISLYAAMMVLTYLCLTTNAPLADQLFDRIDKAMGFDWVAWITWVHAHKGLSLLLAVVYHSLTVQGLCCYIYNIHTRQFQRNSEIWWITFIALLVTIIGSAALPPMNPYVYYGLVPSDRFVHMGIFMGLRDGTLHTINLAMHEGLIQAPSFHTVLAIMVTYNLRHNRYLCGFAAALNSILIVACLSAGSHYLIDLPAGALVAAGTIWVVRKTVRQ
jgi:hypothetical protein